MVLGMIGLAVGLVLLLLGAAMGAAVVLLRQREGTSRAKNRTSETRLSEEALRKARTEAAAVSNFFSYDGSEQEAPEELAARQQRGLSL